MPKSFLIDLAKGSIEHTNKTWELSTCPTPDLIGKFIHFQPINLDCTTEVYVEQLDLHRVSTMQKQGTTYQPEGPWPETSRIHVLQDASWPTVLLQDYVCKPYTCAMSKPFSWSKLASLAHPPVPHIHDGSPKQHQAVRDFLTGYSTDLVLRTSEVT